MQERRPLLMPAVSTRPQMGVYHSILMRGNVRRAVSHSFQPWHFCALFDIIL